MHSKRNDSFLYTCKENYFSGIHPLSPDAPVSEGYKNLVKIFDALSKTQKADIFAQYLLEEKYLCNIWAAHLIMKFGNPQPEMRKRCLEVLEEIPVGR